MRGVACKQLWDNSKAINIRNDARERNESAIFAVQACAVGENPSRKEVRDRAHAVWVKASYNSIITFPSSIFKGYTAILAAGL
jgi:hypothetical protein